MCTLRACQKEVFSKFWVNESRVNWKSPCRCEKRIYYTQWLFLETPLVFWTDRSCLTLSCAITSLLLAFVFNELNFINYWGFFPKGSNVCALESSSYWASLSYNVISYINLRDKQWFGFLFLFFFICRDSGVITWKVADLNQLSLSSHHPFSFKIS